MTGVYAEEFISIESSVYKYLFRLEAEGAVKSSQLTTLPISKSEVLRLVKEAEKNSGKKAYITKLVNMIKEEIGKENFRREASLSYSYTENQNFLYDRNNFGIETEEGNNLFFELPLSYSYKNFGVAASPYFLSNEEYENVSFKELYLLGTYKKFEVSFGKQAQWWGGGKRGSILLSNNAESLNVLRISNSTPYDFIVPFRFTFFLAKLENNRTDVQSPYLHGLRLTLKPTQYLEIGLSKTGLYGGKGRDSGFNAFLDSLIGNKEKNTTGNFNREPGDQRAGFDFKLILPNEIQPVTLYFEAVGEDVSDDFPYPYKYAYIGSVYLPRVLSLENMELLAEYAQTTYKQKRLWYNHHIFSQGYTYNGNIIGHYMGSDAKDFYIKASYNFDKSKLDLSYERYRKYIPNSVWEGYTLTFRQRITSEFGYALETGAYKEDKSKFLISVGVDYKF